MRGISGRFLTVSYLIALALMLIGCPGRRQQLGPGDAGRIVVVAAGTTDPLWPVIKASTGALREGAPDFLVQAVAADGTSASGQVELIRLLPRADLRALCVHPADPIALQEVLEAVRAEGIVVVTIMRRLDSDPAFLYSGIDYRAAGAAMAEALAKLVAGGGTFASLRFETDPRAAELARGFDAEIARHPRLTRLRDLDCRGEPDLARDLMRDGAVRFPGLDGWAVFGDWPLRGGDRTEALAPEDCSLVFPGPLEDMVQDFLSGRCQAVVAADYQQIVTRALEMCVAALRDDVHVPRDYIGPVRTVTLSNLADFQVDWAAWTRPATSP